MSRYRRKAMCWPIGLLILAVGMCGRVRNQSSISDHVHAPERTLAQPSRNPASTPQKPEHVAEQGVGENRPSSPVRPVRHKEDRRLLLKVVGVYDGDTITGLDDSKTQFKIRLDAIDAPELGQPFGQASKKALSEKVFGKNVVVIAKTKDKYGRTVGHVMIDGRDVNLEMLEEGMAWHYVEYDKNKRLAAAEQESRAEKRGLWQDAGAIRPSEWRRRAKESRLPVTPSK
jgi:endonuclease YncB( thermonuclease family)